MPKTTKPNLPWSISSLISKEDKEWLENNATRKQLRYGWFAREILSGTEMPIRYASSLIALSLLVIWLGYLLPSDWLIGQWSSWDAPEQLTYFTTLWSIQATIAALVYPFVISFVTLLLQRRPASKAILQIYLIDSGALVSGLSSLFLVLTMSVQYILLSTYSLGYAVTWAAVSSIWFTFNVVLTIWFLFRTFEFLRSDFQQEVMRRYAVNVSLPRKVSNLLRFQLFVSAQENGWIPGHDYFDESAVGKPKVLLRNFGTDSGDSIVKIALSRRSRLTNVYYWPLRLAVSGWIRTTQKQSEKTPSNQPKSPKLIFPVSVGGEVETSIVIAKVENGPPLSFFQKKLIRLSFKFKPLKSERRYISLTEILNELEADARISAENGDVAAFEDGYNSILLLHEALLGACLSESDDGEMGSWAALEDVHHFSGRTLHILWANIYRSLFVAAVNLLPHETRPIRQLCHIVQNLDGDYLQQSPVKIRENLIFISANLMFALGNWWSLRIEDQGILKHGQNNMALIQPPLQAAYEATLLNFVGGWDSVRDSLAAIPDSDNKFSWSKAGQLLQLNIAHINQTGLMLLKAVSRGDQAAAEWMSDILSKWGANATSYYDDEPFVLYGKTAFITTEAIGKPWPEVKQLLGIDAAELAWSKCDDVSLQRHVLIAAIKNYWKDIRLLTIEILISWAVNEEDKLSDNSLSLYVVSGLLTCKQWRLGGNTDDLLNSLTAPSYIKAKARQQAADSGFRQGYIAKLDAFVESAKDILRPDMVPGRVYSYYGADNVESLKEAQIVMMTILSSSDWGLEESLRNQLAKWVSSSFKSSAILKSRVETLISFIENQANTSFFKVADQLIQLIDKPHSRHEGIARSISGLKSLLKEIDDLQSETVNNAKISADRVSEIEQASSEKAFKKETGEFPIQLFSELTHDYEQKESFTLTFQKLRKGEFTEDLMAQRAVNETYASAVASQVGRVLLFDVLNKCTPRELFASDAESYWVILKTEANRLTSEGLTPVLILENPTLPEWIWAWQHPGFNENYPRPTDLTISREKPSRGDSYIYDMNNIQVYSAHISSGESIVIARETFRHVGFKKYRDDVFVEANITDVPASKTLVDLKLTYERAVEVEYPNYLKIRY